MTSVNKRKWAVILALVIALTSIPFFAVPEAHAAGDVVHMGETLHGSHPERKIIIEYKTVWFDINEVAKLDDTFKSMYLNGELKSVSSKETESGEQEYLIPEKGSVYKTAFPASMWGKKIRFCFYFTDPEKTYFSDEYTILPDYCDGEYTLDLRNGAVSPEGNTEGGSFNVPLMGVIQNTIEAAGSIDKTYEELSFSKLTDDESEGYFADVDLDKDGTKDLRITEEFGGLGEYTYMTLPTCSIAGEHTIKLTETASMEMSYQSKVHFNRLTILMTRLLNKLSVTGKTATVKYSKLKKKSQKVKRSKVLTLNTPGIGEKTYTKKKGSKKITINNKTGEVTVKKGLKKGTYKVIVAVKAAGNADYSQSKTVKTTFKIRVK